MALPVSGSISAAQINVELGRASNAPLSMGGGAERGLAGRASGGVSFADFHGKASEIAVSISGGAGSISIQDLFSSGDWTGNVAKRVVVPQGVERGSPNPSLAALVVGAQWGGVLTIEVRGTLSGAGGAPNSGAGGPALSVPVLGLSGQQANVLVTSTGVIRGGGGGGGRGGTGGGGYTTSPVTVGPYGSESAPRYRVRDSSKHSYSIWDWNGVSLGNVAKSITSRFIAPYTYTKGSAFTSGADGSDDSFTSFRISRTETVTNHHSGGTGGAGGTGEGYGQSRTSGSAGAAGGTNAGAGGTGGIGGLYGAAGVNGATGVGGNFTGGSAGASGGPAGYSIENIANTILSNNGTLLGRT